MCKAAGAHVRPLHDMVKLHMSAAGYRWAINENLSCIATLDSPTQTRMKKLEQVRLEVDSRRHTVSQLAQKIEKQRAKLTAAGDRQKSEENIETTIRRMQHKENKLAGARPRQPAALQVCFSGTLTDGTLRL